MNIKVGIGVIILDDNKILLGHRCTNGKDTGGIFEPGSWTLPGGKQEYEETILEGAKREVKEETNLDISELEVFGAVDDFGEDRHFVTLFVKATKYTGELKVMEVDKLDEWKWFDLNDLPSNLYSPSKKEIEAFIKERKI